MFGVNNRLLAIFTVVFVFATIVVCQWIILAEIFHIAYIDASS